MKKFCKKNLDKINDMVINRDNLLQINSCKFSSSTKIQTLIVRLITIIINLTPTCKQNCNLINPTKQSITKKNILLNNKFLSFSNL